MANGKSKFGWLVHPSGKVGGHFVVAEQPVILRAGGVEGVYVIEHRIEPIQHSASTYTWVPLKIGGVAVVVNNDNTYTQIPYLGVYRIRTVTGEVPTAGHVSYEEDFRDAEWSLTLGTICGGSQSPPPPPPSPCSL